MSSRHLQDMSSRRLQDMSSRHVFKTSSRHVFKTSSRHVFKTSSKHVFKTLSRHVFKTSLSRFQRNNFSSSKTSSRRLGRRKLLRWRRAEDVFKTSSRPINVCWAVVRKGKAWPLFTASKRIYFGEYDAVTLTMSYLEVLHGMVPQYSQINLS